MLAVHGCERVAFPKAGEHTQVLAAHGSERVECTCVFEGPSCVCKAVAAFQHHC